MDQTMSLLSAVEASDSLLLAEIGAVFLFLGVVAFLAAKLRISAVPFFLVSGLAFGNGGIATFSLSESFLATGAQIGAVLLLLLLGLEYSARELGSAVRLHRSVGVMDVLVNATPGAIAAALLGWGVPGAVALGGITYVSSSGIASQLIRDTGWQRSEVARRTVSVLVVEDLLLAPYLPLVTALVTGLSFVAGLISVSVALIITGAVLLFGVHNETFLSNILNAREPRGLLFTVFGAALLAAGLATYVGFSGAVAAFLIGLLLTGDVASTVRARLSPLRDFFSAVFFLFFGLSTNPAEIPGVFPVALALAVLGTAGKLFIGWYAARDLSDQMSWRRVGAFLIPRGEFSIIIAGLVVGMSYSREIQALTTTYVILTAIFGSLAIASLRSRFDR
jgi:CPA2 family monovalent cation:H+ antiporter-2